MSAPKHTPGPWIAKDTHIIKPREDGDWLHGKRIADAPSAFHSDDPELAESYANAARIVACVNACEGLADPSVVPEMVEAMRLAVLAGEGQGLRELLARAEGRNG